VRLDRYLFFIRLLKSRTLAQALIEQGHVRIDGKRVAKPSEEVRVDSIVPCPCTAAFASSGSPPFPSVAGLRPKHGSPMRRLTLTPPRLSDERKISGAYSP
jgi:hypothetical protein